MTAPRLIILHPNDGCLTVARALVRRGHTVHMIASAANYFMLSSRGVTGRVLPDPRDDPDAWTAELTELANSGGGVLLCGSDAASEWLSRNRASLPTAVRSFESTDGTHLALMDKRRLHAIATEIGVRVPWTHHVSKQEEFDALLPDLTFPCVLKATLSHVARAALGHGTLRIDSAEELIEHAGKLLELELDFLLSEVVPGPETNLECAVTVRKADGEYPLEYGRTKVRQWPPDYGVGSVMESKDTPETIAMNRRVLDHVGFVGVSACETKRHAGTGELYLIEINVRVPNGFGLADAMGVDGSWRLYAAAADLPLGPQPAQVNGRKAVFPELEFRAARARITAGDQSLLEVLRSWRGVRNTGVLSFRDPGPVLTLLGGIARRKLRRLINSRRADTAVARTDGRRGEG